MPQYELNIRDYLRIFRKRKVVIIATFITVVSISAFYVSFQPVYYQSSATVKIEERKTIAGLLTEWIVYSPGDIMETETKAIRGYPVILNAARRLKMISDLSPSDEVNAIVTSLQGSISAERVGQTNMIRITATAPTALRAQEVVNAVSEAYKEENLATKAEQARHARRFIEDQIAALEDRLKKAEEDLRQFGEQVREVQLAEPIQKKLVELEFQLNELLQKYTEKHPLVQQLRQQIKDLESQVKGFSGKDLDYARLNREVEVNRKLYAMLKEKLEEARITEAQKVSDVTIVDPAVVPGSPVSGDRRTGILVGIVLGLVLGVSFAFVVETFDTSMGTIEDVERALKLPVLGVVPSIQQEFKTDQGLIERFRERFAPKAATPQEEKLIRLISHYRPQSPIAEVFRNIHTNLKLSPSKKTILVTSSGPQEGKSSIASNLGIVMAQTGLKTLLVSIDLRRPALFKAFGIKNEPGLHELLNGTATLDEVMNNITDILLGEMKFEDVTRTAGIDNISIIPSGRLPSNPVELLESKELPSLIEKFKAQFDVVIFDAPPVLPVTDASLLAPRVDAVVMVYEIGRVSREALIRAKMQLESVGAKISGVILNNTRPQTEGLSLYPYYQRYQYRYYGKQEKAKIPVAQSAKKT